MDRPQSSELAPIGALLRDAGAAALQHLHTARSRTKPDGTEVSAADDVAERILVAGLRDLYPHAGIVSEEGAHSEGPDGTWHVDPIDGTSAFLEGLAYWGPTVCLVRSGQVQLGAFYVPRLDELWFAERGGGAWRDGVRLDPGDPGPPGRHASLYAPSRFHLSTPVPWPGKVRALGSSAAHLAHVAAGGAHAALIPSWALWDVGCGALLVEEAGRCVCDLHGAPLNVAEARPGLPIVAGAPTALSPLTSGWAAAALHRPG